MAAARAAAGGAGAGLAAGASVAFMGPTAAMWVATTFGTASTGAAISTLSGAAATNAALAWLGGGAVSAGGAGIAGGNAFLAMTGPIGWTIAGATLLTSIVLFTKNRAKGAYKGSLLTRLQSLTTGINGLIFASDELSGDDLFEQNVIVDLSRVGSSETKSLIMGMLVLKLQEFRMTGDIPMNADMRHITVLEEAHNLLRRTSIDQPTESSNILGKSVELITNAIAEMRTYGEGFIIADQAPGLMDMSVIRNTNTKIIMRLPDKGDRDLVGKAADLNDDQINEIAKLPRGVAAIYQNEWVQPVLCMVKKYEGDFSNYEFDDRANNTMIQKDEELATSLLKCIMDKELFQIGDKDDLKELKSIIIRSRLSSPVKVDFIDYIDVEKDEGMKVLRGLIFDFLNAEEAIQASRQFDDIHEWVNSVVEKLTPSVKGYSKKQIDLAIALILQEKTMRDSSYRQIYYSYTEAYKNGGGVF